MGEQLQFYHQPVLLSEVLTHLVVNPEGIYLDGTLGGGGHAETILSRISGRGYYIGIDQDIEAIRYAEQRLSNFKNFSVHHTNFTDFERVLGQLNIDLIDGLLLDLGLSSHQIDEESRGFSYMKSTDLDMRMDTRIDERASDLLNTLEESDLSNIFFKYGEERKSRKIARLIVAYRKNQRIQTSDQLRNIIDRVSPPRFAIKAYARIFQALRLAVNNELEVLEETLNRSLKFMKRGGRYVIISYHSLEDRIVKKFLRGKANPCTCPPDFPLCICGKEPELKIVTPKPLKASEEEIKLNSRARSARLRVGEVL